MATFNNITLSNLTQDQMTSLDTLMNNYNFKYGFGQLLRGINEIVKEKDATISALQKEKATIIDKYEGIVNIKKLAFPRGFKLYTYKGLADTTKLNLSVLKEEYEKDLIIAEENEKVLIENTKIIGSVIKTMELSGIDKSITKYKTARSSTKITVDATWFSELKNLYHSDFNPSSFSYKKMALDAWYSQLTAMVSKAQKEALIIKETEEKQKDLLLKQEKEKQIEAIIIAHTCILYHLDPLKITSREELDKALIELGHVPNSVIQALKLELNLA